MGDGVDQPGERDPAERGEAASGGAERGPVRLRPCGDSGYRLTVGGATVCLSEDELALLGRAIHVMAGRRPALLEKLIAGAVDDRSDDQAGDAPAE